MAPHGAIEREERAVGAQRRWKNYGGFPDTVAWGFRTIVSFATPGEQMRLTSVGIAFVLDGYRFVSKVTLEFVCPSFFRSGALMHFPLRSLKKKR
mmetsp:Transcript_18907/g.43858  ORF Transcript_18907/g.43858 Transcript_18907/m.43858 type:complete len:95 (+) Transcript_18907:642-926(+)